MEFQQTWQGDDGVIRLWERVGITCLHEAVGPVTGTVATMERGPWPACSEPPISIDDYLVEHHLREDAKSIDELTVRQALMALGLTGRAHRYPEWVRAEAWLFMALRIERKISAVEVLARAHDLGFSQSGIEHARVRLGVVTDHSDGDRHSCLRWQLPASVAECGTPAEVDPRWRRFAQYQQHPPA
jgi:hypothetical protein